MTIHVPNIRYNILHIYCTVYEVRHEVNILSQRGFGQFGVPSSSSSLFFATIRKIVTSEKENDKIKVARKLITNQEAF